MVIRLPKLFKSRRRQQSYQTAKTLQNQEEGTRVIRQPKLFKSRRTHHGYQTAQALQIKKATELSDRSNSLNHGEGTSYQTAKTL